MAKSSDKSRYLTLQIRHKESQKESTNLPMLVVKLICSQVTAACFP